MSQLICAFAISSFTELQNIALFLGCPLPEIKDCSEIWFCSFSELQNIALICGCPLSELQKDRPLQSRLSGHVLVYLSLSGAVSGAFKAHLDQFGPIGTYTKPSGPIWVYQDPRGTS